MISNRIEILAHHVNWIEHDCRSSNPDNIRQWAIDYVREAATHKFPNGLPSYPGLDDPEKFEQFVHAHEVAATAIMTKHFRVIREPIDGERRFDLICHACGNYELNGLHSPECFYEKRFCL